LDIGGCSACLSPAAGRNNFAKLKKTSFEGYAGLKKYQDSLAEAVLEEVQQEGSSSCILLETPVVKKAQLDTAWLQEQLAEKQIDSVVFPTNGYKTSAEGVASALLQLGEQAKRLCRGTAPAAEPKLIGVLGADSGQSALREKIHHGIEHFLQDGYEALFPEDLTWQEMDRLAAVRLNWVVSAVAIPLAEFMQREFGIPYLAAIPVGARAMLLWRNQVNQMMCGAEAKVLEIPPLAQPASGQKKVLVVGDPVLTAGIRHYYLAMEGCRQVDRAVYAPVPSLAEFTARAASAARDNGLQDEVLSLADAPLQFSNTQEWQELSARYDIIICDRLMQLCLGDRVQPERWINIPDGIFSSGLLEEADYTIFGKKGAAWLKGTAITM